MGYKNIKPVLIMFTESFVYRCRLSIDKDDMDICLSKSKSKEDGECDVRDCPLMYTASLTDLKEHDIDLYNEYKRDFKEALNRGESEDDLEPAQVGSFWAIQYKDFIAP